MIWSFSLALDVQYRCNHTWQENIG